MSVWGSPASDSSAGLYAVYRPTVRRWSCSAVVGAFPGRVIEGHISNRPT